MSVRTMRRHFDAYVIWAAFIVMSSANAPAQSLLSEVQSPQWPQNPNFSTVQIDPATGALQTLVYTEFVGPVGAGVSAFDPVNRRLFSLGEIDGVPQLITVDLSSATTRVQPLPMTGYACFAYDPATHRVLAVTGSGGTAVVAIDPETASVTTLITTGFSGSIHPGVSSYDSIHRRLFFVGATNPLTLFIADLSDNSVVTRLIPASVQLFFLEYEASTDRLISALTSAGRPVISIDPATGSIQSLFAIGFTGGLTLHISAFDPTTRRVFMRGEFADVQQLITIDLDAKTASVKPMPADGICLFLELQESTASIPALHPVVVALLAAALAGLALLRLSRAA